MNAWGFLEEIKNMFSERNLCVIIVSSFIQISDRNKARSFNHVVNFMEKSIKRADMAQLKEVVSSWLYGENADSVKHSLH